MVHEQRTVIKFYVKLGKNMPEIKEDLQKVNRDSCFINSCTVKTLYNVIRYNRIFNIQQKIAGIGSVSIKIPF